MLHILTVGLLLRSRLAKSLHRPALLRLHAAGEYGELLVGGSKLLENEEALTVSEGEVVSLLESVLERTGISGQAERIKVSFQLLQPQKSGPATGLKSVCSAEGDALTVFMTLPVCRSSWAQPVMVQLWLVACMCASV